MFWLNSIHCLLVLPVKCLFVERANYYQVVAALVLTTHIRRWGWNHIHGDGLMMIIKIFWGRMNYNLGWKKCKYSSQEILCSYELVKNEKWCQKNIIKTPNILKQWRMRKYIWTNITQLWIDEDDDADVLVVTHILRKNEFYSGSFNTKVAVETSTNYMVVVFFYEFWWWYIQIPEHHYCFDDETLAPFAEQKTRMKIDIQLKFKTFDNEKVWT